MFAATLKRKREMSILHIFIYFFFSSQNSSLLLCGMFASEKMKAKERMRYAEHGTGVFSMSMTCGSYVDFV